MSPATARSGRRSVTMWTASAVVILVVVAVTGLGGQVPALAFRQAGHWVYNNTVGTVFHIDGGSKSIDARMSLPGVSPENQVLQDDQHGYVVDRRNGRVLVFGKSTLSVDSTLSVGSTDEPVTLEVTGGPYLVYERSGRIIRLGQPPITVNAGGALQTPVATTTGTVWVQRKDGALCELTAGSHTLKCRSHIPAGHHGALTTVDDQPAFVDITADTIQIIAKNGLGKPRPLGVQLPAGAQISGADAGGRLPIITPDYQHQPALLLIDTSTLELGKPAAKPIAVPLHGDKFDAPITSGGAIAVVDTSTHQIITYTDDGTQKASIPVPAGSGTLQVSRGEDGRVYIDNAAGTETFVVDGDGSVTPVDVGKDGGNGRQSSASPPKNPPKTPPTKAKSPPKKPVGPPLPVPTKAVRPVHVPTQPSPTNTPVQPTVQPTQAPPPTQPPPTQPPPSPTPTAHVPAAPPAVQATPGSAQAVVSWTTPADNGAPILNYVVSWRGGSATVPAGHLSTTITGLANGSSYVVSVAARNAIGQGPATSSPAFVPNPALTAPTDVTARATSDGTATVQWQEAATRTTHGAVSFRVTTAGGRALSTTKTQLVFTGLTAGSSYRFTVAATDGSGQARSATSGPVTAYSAPGAPGGLTATPGSKQVALSWKAPAANGSRITGYTVSFAGGTSRTVTTTSTTITGLADGTAHTFSVVANGEDPNGSGTKVSGAPATVSATAITATHVPYITIDEAHIDSDHHLVVTVDVDAGGDPNTKCNVTFMGVSVWDDICAHGRDTITATDVDSNNNTNVPVTVTGTNAAGTGPTETTTVSDNGGDGSHTGSGREFPPARKRGE